MAQWTADQLEYLLQFQHPEKMLRAMPGLRAEHVAAMFQIDLATYRRVRGRFARRARRAAAELLDGHACPARLPFRPGQVVGSVNAEVAGR